MDDALRAALNQVGVADAATTPLRLLTSLLSKRFVIFTGLSGSGKTQLAHAFARWITPSKDAYAVIPVGADWTGNDAILGYPDGLDAKNYVRRPALDLILRANANPDTPHVLILDEMNLSHVERYFADFLSAMESNEPIPLFAGADKRGDVPAQLKFPPNLFVIGTVNVDETTYMFSPKVLDRAHVIEFRMPATALTNFLSAPGKVDLSKLDGQGHTYGASFVATANSDLPIDDVGGERSAAAAVLQQFFAVLQPHNAEFGFRTANEVMRFVAAWQLLGGSDTDVALDYVILQKLLPKLHGSRAKLEPLLKDLLAATLRADVTADFRDVASFEKNHPKEQRRFPESADKLVRMWRVLERDQFASFAEA